MYILFVCFVKGGHDRQAYCLW